MLTYCVSPLMNVCHLPSVRRHGFTLVEVMVSVAILSMILLVVTQVIGAAQRSWKFANARLGQFREARQAFDRLTTHIKQATILPYTDFLYGTPGSIDQLAQPGRTTRQAELGFVLNSNPGVVFPSLNGEDCGDAVLFQAPIGYSNIAAYRQLNNLLCPWGYAVQFGLDTDFVPQGLASSLTPRGRYRLLEYRTATEFNQVYDSPDHQRWLAAPIGNGIAGTGQMVPIAENVIALTLAAIYPDPNSNGPVAISQVRGNFANAVNTYTALGGIVAELPQAIRVTMVSIDEASAARLVFDSGGRSPSILARSGASFNAPAQHAVDLERLTGYLTNQAINYRVFSSTVTLPAGAVE
jgi:uncharacterized protein (TIGR02599 family)